MGQASAVWIDVEDLFHYVRHNARLSGIQRLTYELYTALEDQEATGRRVGYVRIDRRSDTFRVVPWEQVRALCHGLTVSHIEPSLLPAILQQKPRMPVRQMPRHLAVALQDRLPGPARERFRRFCALQSGALHSLAELTREGAAAGRRRARPVVPPARSAALVAVADTPADTGVAGVALLDVARPGDWLLSLGASWHRTDYGRLLERVRHDGGLRTGLLFYDLIPLRRPEWCHHTLVDTFGRWLDGVLPFVDAMFAISKATADDVTQFLAERDGSAMAPVLTIPVGTGFPASAAAMGAEAEQVPDHAVPPPGSYVLFVSTIEARKNHLLMFQVWRRLIETLPADQVPTLVFAGRVGWLVADLMLQIANTNYCDGKLLIVEDPSDAVLMRLYDGCLFTVLPSLFEGWGLPVTESLAAGKPCVISNLTSLPEAGAGLARMLDPFDLNDAYRVIADTLADREGLRSWEQEVRRSFEPVPWARSAEALLRGLDAEERRTSASVVRAVGA
jgi:glycosyltransferase involved in cell wall biosynthesis